MSFPGLKRAFMLTVGVLVWSAFVQAQTGSSVPHPCPRPASQGDTSIRIVYYDARQDKILFDDGKPVPSKLESGDHVTLEVCRAHFGEQFNFKLIEKVLPEAGAPVRGLDEAAGLIKGLPGSPAGKGAVLLEGVSINTYSDVPSIVARLRSLPDVVGLKTELQLEFESIRYARKSVSEDFDRYKQAICQMTTQVLAAECANTGGPTRVDTAEKGIQKLTLEVETADNGVRVPSGTGANCPGNVDPPQGRDVYADRTQFVCFANQTNLIIQQFNNLRTAIQQPPIGSAAADLVAESDELKKRIVTYQKKLSQVEAATSVEKLLFKSDPETLLSRLKKLRDTYKDVLTPEDIQRIALDQERSLNGEEGKQILLELDLIQQGSIPGIKAQLNGVASDLTRTVTQVKELDQAFGQRVQQVNSGLASEIKKVFALYAKSEVDVIFVQMLTWSGNTGVILTVKVEDSFRQIDLAKLESPSLAAVPQLPASVTSASLTPAFPSVSAQAQQQNPAPPSASPKGGSVAPQAGGTPGSGGQAQDGNAGGVSTTEFPVTAATNTAFEVHKTYRFNIAAGVLFSSVRQDSFTLRNIPGTDKNGNPVTNLFLVPTGSDHVRVDFPVFLTMYLGKPLDVFSKTTANRTHFGTALGFSTLDPGNNAYLGGFWQPRLGMDVLFGLHLGRRNVADNGVIPNVTILNPGTMTAPIHQEWKPGFFFTLGFDALTFKKLFAGTP
jgi:hypothetical protein